MIREDDLVEAIKECEGERHPDANTCIKLSAFYDLLDRYAPKETPTEIPNKYNPQPSTAQAEIIIDNYGDDDFLGAVGGKPAKSVWPILDELMMTLEVLNKPLHDHVLRKIEAIG